METYIEDLLLKQPFENIMYIALMNGISYSVESRTGWLQAHYNVGTTKYSIEPNSDVKKLTVYAIISKLKEEDK